MATTNPSNDPTKPPQILSVTYQSPTNEPFSRLHELNAPATEDATDRASYLSSLRKATAEFQEFINAELTSRMQDDKLREAEGGAVKKGAVDDAKEEENYGEEVVEDDA